MNRTFYLLFLLLALATSQSVFAADKYWTGAGNTNNWSDASNWNPVGIPTSSDYVYLNVNGTGSPIIEPGTSATVIRLIMDHRSLTVSLGATLKCVESLSTSASLNVRDDGILNNYGTILIETLTGEASNSPISSDLNGIINNYGLIQINYLGPYFNINMGSNVQFINHVCGQIVFKQSTNGIGTEGGAFINNGLVISNGRSNAYNQGTVTNNGVLKYVSQGSNIIHGEGSLIVNDTPTPIFAYTGTFLGTIYGIYRNAAATLSAGTFTAPNTFTPSGLPTGSQTLYARITPAGQSCIYIVPFTYIPPPTFTTNPTSKSLCSGTSTTFTVAANGANSYRWQVNTGSGEFTDLSNNSTYSGVTSTTLTINTIAESLNGYQYRCVATGDGGSTNSNGATLTVYALPTANIQIPSSTTLTCTTTSISLTATGGGTYRWDDNTTANVRSVTALGTYSVTVTNTNGCTAVDTQEITSNTATLSVSNPTITTATMGTAFSQTFTTTLTNVTGNPGIIQYTLASGTLPTGLSLAESGVLSGTPTQTGQFTLTLQARDANGCLGSNASNPYVLTLAQPPALGNLAASPNPVCQGSLVTFTATVGNAANGYSFTLSNGSNPLIGNSTQTTFSQSMFASGSGSQSYTLTMSNGGAPTSVTTNVLVNPLPMVTLSFPEGTTVIGPSTGTATVIVPSLVSLFMQVGSGVLYELVQILDRINGYEIRRVDSNSTGLFPINHGGPYRVTVTDGNGCQRTGEGTIVVQPR